MKALPAGLTFVTGTGTLAQARQHLGALLFPDPALQAWHRPLREPLVGVTGLLDGKPIASLLADLSPEVARADLRSLFVQVPLRGQGIATALVARAEHELAERGARTVEVAYRTDWPQHETLERVLARRGWDPPRLVSLLYKGETARMQDAPWLEAADLPLPEGYEVFPWAELAPHEKAAMLDEQRIAPWFPPELTPFQLEAQVDPAYSLGLRHGGQIVGWVIGHRLRPDVVQYTTIFTREGVPPGRIVSLMAAAARRQRDDGVPISLFMVSASNTPARAFAERRLAPYLVSRAEVRVAGKRLASATHGGTPGHAARRASSPYL